MPAETFRLQSILQLRESLQQQRQAELGQAVQAQQILEAQFRQIETQLSDIEAEIRASLTASVDVDHLMALRRFQADTRGQSRQLQEQQQLVQQEIERRQARLTEASREVQVMEKLKQTYRERRQTAELRREQALLDEFAQRDRVNPEREPG
jgi:flagellar export protein FliJ